MPSQRADALDVIRTFDALEGLRDEWNALASTCATPMLDHAWVTCAARHLHAEEDLRIVVVRDAGALAGVAPLVIDRERGRRLVLPGARALYEPGGWLFSSLTVLDRLSSAVGTLGETVVLERIPVESALCHGFVTGLGKQTVTVIRQQSPSLRVPTNGATWETYAATLSRRTRSRLRISWANAERRVGAPAIRHIEPSCIDVVEWLNRFVALERAGWKGRSGSALASRPRSRAFFEDYCRRLADRGELRVTTLTLGSRLAAIELSADAYDRRWALKITYNEDFAAYGPAFHVVDASVHATFERGLEAYEFLGVAEPWQRRWKPVEQHYRTAALYRYGTVGLGCAVKDLAEFLAR